MGTRLARYEPRTHSTHQKPPQPIMTCHTHTPHGVPQPHSVHSQHRTRSFPTVHCQAFIPQSRSVFFQRSSPRPQHRTRSPPANIARHVPRIERSRLSQRPTLPNPSQPCLASITRLPTVGRANVKLYCTIFTHTIHTCTGCVL